MNKIREMNKKAIEQVLVNRILFIGEEHQAYTGSPAELIEELADAIPNQIELLAGAFKKIYSPEILKLMALIAEQQGWYVPETGDGSVR